ncbi:pseudouridine synthase [Streptomyces sp. CA2R106]|uniref:pseudouridine synthase n=1 Tax=Streptomyces sp. CA2R106 TaxID=3120153 RepID=UPI0030080A13
MARRPGRRAPVAPLEQREGIDPVRVRLPGPGAADGATGQGRGQEQPPWTTVGGYLLARYGPAVGRERIEAMLAAGAFVTADGPVRAATPYVPGAFVWFHRDRPPEPAVPFPVEVLHRDERIVVADKPHFLATTPRGSHVTETALARLRRDLGLPDLTPAHRLDRLTAGVVLFVVRPEDRGAYQTLFRDRRTRKEYEAVAPYDPLVALPATVRSRIVKERGEMAAREVPGPENAVSTVELAEHRGGLGRYRLRPLTGRTHQLRVHMHALGLPLLNDPIYPAVLPEDPADPYARPLQLLARTLEFTDPRTGRELRFDSARRLAAWPPADS